MEDYCSGPRLHMIRPTGKFVARQRKKAIRGKKWKAGLHFMGTDPQKSTGAHLNYHSTPALSPGRLAINKIYLHIYGGHGDDFRGSP